MIPHRLLIILMLALIPFQMSQSEELNTSSFHVKYDRSISAENARLVGKWLEETYSSLQRKYNLTFSRAVEVRLLGSVVRFQAETRSGPFSDGFFTNGRAYLVVIRGAKDQERMKEVIRRVVMSALLANIRQCPRWFGEAFALYVGNDLDDFGQPAQFTLQSFGDLGEEYLRAGSAKEWREVYSKLAATANFLIDRYGERKFLEVILEMKTGTPLDEALESVLGEKVPAIEKVWVQSLRQGRSK